MSAGNFAHPGAAHGYSFGGFDYSQAMNGQWHQMDRTLQGGFSWAYYQSSSAFPGWPGQEAAVNVNFDDFSDVSDSDSEEESVCQKLLERSKALRSKLSTDTDSLSEPSDEPAAEPSPTADKLEDSNSVAGDLCCSTRTTSVMSSGLLSESDNEIGEEVLDRAALLRWRPSAGVLKAKLYDTVERQPQAAKPLPGSPKNVDECWRRPQASPKAEPDDRLTVSASSWVARQRKKDQFECDDERVARTVKSILNKLTLEKFSSLAAQLLDCGVSKTRHVEMLIHEVFEKATSQHHFIDMYADLCVVLHEHFTAHPFDSAAGNEQRVTFKKLLLGECQASFERLVTPPEAVAEPGSEEQRRAEARYKMHMLGNIKLIGGLLSRGMLAGKVAIAIMEELLSNPTPEALESVAALLTATGSTFDKPGWQYHAALNYIFERVKVIAKQKQTKPRERCLLQDLLDLRANGWEDQRQGRKERAATLAEVAQQAAGGASTPTAVRKVRVTQKPAAGRQRKRGVLASPKAFDREAFREESRKVFRELRHSADIGEARERLAALGKPPLEEQHEEVCELLALLVQEGSVETRRRCTAAMVEMLQGQWQPDALRRGIDMFLSEIAPDLCCDVPALPQIMAELRSDLEGSLLPEVLRKLRAFKC